ncbi:aspartate--tRNA ligase [Candidatus Saccharibacteria bacterium]|nr:aspartate--tRNA ligase [Candidatus Saccharibacteria bacterium]MBR6122389.1 aspartate--tRNA ligase [Candidatus Saccharibacteria bacterium]
MYEKSLALKNFLGKTVTVAGWVNSRRDHGGLIFIDLRDFAGLIQLVVTPDTAESFKLAESVRDEYVLRATGKIRERAPELKNPNIPTGDIELVVDTLELLNRSDTPLVNTHDEGTESGEDLRLKYRFLDLRRPSMQKLLADRSRYYKFLRDYMYDAGFTEITTPILANSSPEGARDFLIPSRLHPGKFYALPQAPQQFKQLLMVGGVERYFQIAPCFRDEDPRADRLYGDFYQLDCEMSFVEDGEVVRKTTEPLIVKLATEFANKKLVMRSEPAKQFIGKGSAIPRIPYDFAMNTYGVDKPDLRYGMELIELTDVFKNTDFKVFKQPCVKALCVKGAASLTRSQIDAFTEEARKLGAGGLAYILYVDGEAKSPILKFMSEQEIKDVKKLTGAEDGDAVFFGAAEREKVNKVLGQLRISFADHFGLKNENEVALTWIIDFPFYEWDDKNRKLDFGHNPFSMPKGGLQALESAKTDTEKLAIVADQYDMVMNGYEICSGAVRNYNPEIMYKVFNILGYNNAYVEARFGGMLNAFKFGAPPHAGCAFGIDRIFMVLENAKNIRDIIAFPKNGSGIDLMMDSPSTVDQIQLDEAHLAIIKDEE